MNRSELAARVRALLSKTTANGATEAEAMSALAKAKELMDKYQLDHGALEMEQEGTTRYDSPFGNLKDRLAKQIYSIRNDLFYEIGQFTDTKAWHSSSNSAHVFFGLRSDIEFANWLLEHLSNYIIAQSSAYKLRQILDANNLTDADEHAFISAATMRIRDRLREMTRERKATATGTALIPLKNQIVMREFDKLGIRLSPGRLHGSAGGHSAAAAAAGRAAGNAASFARPVSNRTAGLLK